MPVWNWIGFEILTNFIKSVFPHKSFTVNIVVFETYFYYNFNLLKTHANISPTNQPAPKPSNFPSHPLTPKVPGSQISKLKAIIYHCCSSRNSGGHHERTRWLRAWSGINFKVPWHWPLTEEAAYLWWSSFGGLSKISWKQLGMFGLEVLSFFLFSRFRWVSISIGTGSSIID